MKASSQTLWKWDYLLLFIYFRYGIHETKKMKGKVSYNVKKESVKLTKVYTPGNSNGSLLNLTIVNKFWTHKT